MEENKQKVYWLADSEENKQYEVTTWYRCMGGQKFVELVEKKAKIVAIIFSDNNIGFILDEESNQ